jgi:hypothetical protein
MSNPVMDALVMHRASEMRNKDMAVSRELAARIGMAPPSADLPSAFARWAELRGVVALPAKPDSVAFFILESKDLGLESLCEIASGISKAHQNFGDPVASFQVRRAFETIGGQISEPRSWPKINKQAFRDLPWHIQRVIESRETDHNTMLRRCQNEAADLRKQLKQIEKKDAEKNTTEAA